MQDIQQPDKYKTDFDQIMKVPKKVTFEVVYGRTCMGRSVRDHDWCVWVYFGYTTYISSN